MARYLPASLATLTEEEVRDAFAKDSLLWVGDAVPSKSCLNDVLGSNPSLRGIHQTLLRTVPLTCSWFASVTSAFLSGRTAIVLSYDTVTTLTNAAIHAATLLAASQPSLRTQTTPLVVVVAPTNALAAKVATTITRAVGTQLRAKALTDLRPPVAATLRTPTNLVCGTPKALAEAATAVPKWYADAVGVVVVSDGYGVPAAATSSTSSSSASLSSLPCTLATPLTPLLEHLPSPHPPSLVMLPPSLAVGPVKSLPHTPAPSTAPSTSKPVSSPTSAFCQVLSTSARRGDRAPDAIVASAAVSLLCTSPLPADVAALISHHAAAAHDAAAAAAGRAATTPRGLGTTMETVGAAVVGGVVCVKSVAPAGGGLGRTTVPAASKGDKVPQLGGNAAAVADALFGRVSSDRADASLSFIHANGAVGSATALGVALRGVEVFAPSSFDVGVGHTDEGAAHVDEVVSAVVRLVLARGTPPRGPVVEGAGGEGAGREGRRVVVVAHDAGSLAKRIESGLCAASASLPSSDGKEALAGGGVEGSGSATVSGEGPQAKEEGTAASSAAVVEVRAVACDDVSVGSSEVAAAVAWFRSRGSAIARVLVVGARVPVRAGQPSTRGTVNVAAAVPPGPRPVDVTFPSMAEQLAAARSLDVGASGAAEGEVVGCATLRRTLAGVGGCATDVVISCVPHQPRRTGRADFDAIFLAIAALDVELCLSFATVPPKRLTQSQRTTPQSVAGEGPSVAFVLHEGLVDDAPVDLRFVADALIAFARATGSLVPPTLLALGGTPSSSPDARSVYLRKLFTAIRLMRAGPQKRGRGE